MTLATPLAVHIALGSTFEGGFFAGLIHQADGLYALIVAPKAEGETSGIWLETYTEIKGAASFFDGAANTVAMAEAGSPLAKWAQALDIAGFKDWYLPARDELEIIYRYLKPTTETNWCYRGDNPSSVPVGYPYTAQMPAQTETAIFQEGGEQAMEASLYWSSTQYSRYNAWLQDFVDGYANILSKDYEGKARAVRRFKVQ